MFHQLSIKARLIVAFSAIIVLVVLSSLIVAGYVHGLSADVHAINDRSLPLVQTVDDMNLARSDVQQFLTDVSATHEADGYKDAEDAYKRFQKDIALFRAIFQKDNNTEGLKTLDGLEEEFTKFYTLGKQMAAAYVSDGMDAGNILMKGVDGKPGFDQASDDIQKHLEAFQALQTASAANTTADALGKADQVLTITLTSGLVSTVLAVVFSALVLRSILRQLGGEPSKAAEFAKTVGAGDLSQPIALHQDDTSSLLWNLKHMQENLARVVSRVRRDAQGVATASSEIAEGNSELAKRTEHQASALVQTASSMKDLADAVEQNAESAQAANQLARTAAHVAAQGGAVVSQVVDTMRGINESSRKISDIISVIDGIAFQTNILALNAAVEAARAGEQGRGFAVVASEVRSLAGRSAEAAREIKTLINASVERVEQGTSLVDQAGTTMEQVVASISQVTEMMGRISTASHEQSAGVAQMGQAVSTFEQSTQQNAALVEQLDAAARTLKDGATNLLGTVGEFKLAGSLPSVPPSPRMTPRATTTTRTALTPSPHPHIASPRTVPARQVPSLPTAAKTATTTAAENEDWETF